jgi:CubicO group peptidase (beta-lactamase class C family)
MRCGVRLVCGALALVLPHLAGGHVAGPAAAEAAALQGGGRSADPATVTTPAAPRASDAEIAAFAEGYMRTAVDMLGLPGATLTVLRDGRPLVAQAWGVADRATGRRVDHAATLFRQASISKLFIYVLAFQQIEAGRLDLEADINRYLDFRVEGLGGAPITLRHLLTHSAGFEERMNGVFFHDPALPPGQRLAASIPPRVARPGSMIAYSNYGASLVARIVERSAGAPFETLVEQRIFAPLGMTRSSFAQDLPPALRANLALGYRPGSDEPIAFEVIDPAAPGGLSATSADMARFLAALSTGGPPLMRPQTLARMTELAMPVAPGLGAGMALGPIVQTHRGVRIVGHGGNLGGSATDLAWMPSTGIAWHVAVAGQGPDGAANRLRDGLKRAMAERFGTPGPAIATASSGVSTAADLAGRYWPTRRAYSNWLVVQGLFQSDVFTPGDRGVLLQPSAPQPDGRPRAWHPVARDRFVDPATGHELVATRDQAGRVTRLGLTSMPVSQYDRAPGWQRPVQLALVGALLVLQLAVFSGPVGWVARRVLGQPRREDPPPGRLGARLAALLLFTAVLSWVGLISWAGSSGDLKAFSPFENPWIRPTRILWAAGVGAALALAWYAVRRWVRGEGSLGGRISSTITALAGLVLAWAFLRFHQLKPGADF